MGTVNAMSVRSLQYYVIARRWVSDIEFFKVETGFLYRLLNTHFSRLSNDDYVDQLKRAGKKLVKLEQDKHDADVLLTEQLKHLELMAEDIIPENIDALEGKQIKIEYLMNNLTGEYREVKKEIFELVEKVMSERCLLI